MPKKPLNSRLLSFATNIFLWMFFCIIVLIYRSITNQGSMLQRLLPEDKLALSKFIDLHLLWFTLGACMILFFLTSFIGHKVSTPNTEHRLRAMLDQICHEASSILLNFGSMFFAIGYFAAEPIYLLSGLSAWGGWWIVKPRQCSEPGNKGRNKGFRPIK